MRVVTLAGLQVKAIVARERPTVTRESLLRSQTRSFKHILNLMYLRQNEAKNLHRQSGKRGAQRHAIVCLSL